MSVMEQKVRESKHNLSSSGELPEREGGEERRSGDEQRNLTSQSSHLKPGVGVERWPQQRRLKYTRTKEEALRYSRSRLDFPQYLEPSLH